MKSIVFRIRKPYFEAIVKGVKRVEWRKDTPFWKKRLQNAEIAVFICGKRVHRRKITYVQKTKTPDWFSEQGKADVNTPTCFAIYLGEEFAVYVNKTKEKEVNQIDG